VALLGELRLFETLSGLLEIGAGVLLVGVEEEPVEPLVEIVVLRDVALRADRVVRRRKAARELTQRDDGAYRQGRALASGVLQGELEEIVNRALLDHEPLIHEELAETQVRIGDERELRRVILEADRDLGRRPVADDELAAGSRDHAQCAAFHEGRNDGLQQAIADRLTRSDLRRLV
jgi:hypothetical protein